MRKKKQIDREKEEEDRLKASRKWFKPDTVKVLLVVEFDRNIEENDSFYLVEPEGKEDILFVETIKTLYPDKYSDDQEIRSDKAKLLDKLKKDGFYMIDGSKKKRQKKVVLPTIRRYVREVANKSNTLIIVISTNHSKDIIEDLRKHKFKVINNEAINFPYEPEERNNFREKVSELFELYNIDLGGK